MKEPRFHLVVEDVSVDDIATLLCLCESGGAGADRLPKGLRRKLGRICRGHFDAYRAWKGQHYYCAGKPRP